MDAFAAIHSVHAEEHRGDGGTPGGVEGANGRGAGRQLAADDLVPIFIYVLVRLVRVLSARIVYILSAALSAFCLRLCLCLSAFCLRLVRIVAISAS